MNGKSSFVIVGADGALRLENITTEDALKMLVAEDLDRSMRSQMEADHMMAEHEQATASVPPAHFKSGKADWDVLNIPAWSTNDGLMADTNCYLKRIRVKEDGSDKPDSVLHELLHVATKCDPSPRVHEIIYGLAPALLKILQDNPDMVAYLMTKPTGGTK